MKNLEISVVFFSNFSETEKEVILEQWLMISPNRQSSVTEIIIAVRY